MNNGAAYRRGRWMFNLRARVVFVVDLMTLCRCTLIRVRLKCIIMSTNCTVSGDEEKDTSTALLDEAGPLEAP